MLKMTTTPPLPGAATGGSFVQTVTLSDGPTVIGLARWHTSSSMSEGVVQLLDLYVHPPHQRKGHGGRLLKEVFAQAAAYFKLHRGKLRRVWAAVEHKQHVTARAFLTAHGFHHISTMKELYRDQDQLLYTRAFD
jgi:GNAT superfamily N-acetyltransferase